MTADLIRAFRALRTPDSRKQAVEALFAELTPHEWRAASAFAATRHFHCDIIGALPLELVAHVFSYLDHDITLPFRLQRVSKRWQTLLQSLVVLRSIMHPLEGRPTQCVNYSDFLCKAQYIHRFRAGKPREVTVMDMAETEYLVHHHRRTFSDDSYTWLHISGWLLPVLIEHFLVGVDQSKRAIVAHNLRDGTSWHSHSPARERIYKFIATTNFVLMATRSGKAYLYHSNGTPMGTFTLPAQHFTIVGGHGELMALGAILPSKVSMYMRNLGESARPTVHIERSQPPFCYWNNGCKSPSASLLLNTETDTMVFFTINSCQSGACEACYSIRGTRETTISFGTYTLDGHLLNHGARQIDGMFHRLSLQSLEPIDRQGQYVIRMWDYRERVSGFHVVFDERRQALVPPPDGDGYLRSRQLLGSLSRFNHTFYDQYMHAHSGETVLLSSLYPSEINKSKPVIVIDENAREFPTHLLVNDQFVVLWTERSIPKEGEEEDDDEVVKYIRLRVLHF